MSKVTTCRAEEDWGQLGSREGNRDTINLKEKLGV
tara:strand:+ start:516 stop:620 length:105 start_codon:yes stop_codon:yes gene_type:complete